MGAHLNKTDRPTREVLDAIRQLVRSLRESSREAEKKVGLSGAQLFVLQTLARGTPLSLNELAAATATHQSSVSVVVSRLVKRSLVARDRSNADGRRLDLTLTKAGRALIRRSPRVAQQQLLEGLRRLSPSERETLASSLRRLVARMGLADRKPSMFFEESRRV